MTQNSAVETDAVALERRTMSKVTWRLLPFLMVCYLFALIDRSNVGMASLQMNEDLGFTKAVFGFGASLFFYSYFLMEVPSNLMLQKVGARRWIARIMITWGLISAGMSMVTGVNSFYAMRLLLGAAEAGFFPGVVLYLTYWLPPSYRGRILATFAISIPAASFIGSPLSGLLLQMDGVLGLHGWQWLFIVEGIPASLLGIACLFVLTDRPGHAKWLTEEERAWLEHQVTSGAKKTPQGQKESSWSLLRNKHFWAMVLACSGASAAGSTLGVWQPQLIKSFGLTDLQTGLVGAIPYGIAAVLMVFWGRHSDKTGERRWHTALSLLLIVGGAAATLTTGAFIPTLVMLSCILVGTYSFKGPFWSLASGWLSPATAAAGIAAINATANLVGGGIMVNVYGYVHEKTDSYAMALLPLAVLTGLSALAILALSAKDGRKAQALAAQPETGAANG